MLHHIANLLVQALERWHAMSACYCVPGKTAHDAHICLTCGTDTFDAQSGRLRRFMSWPRDALRTVAASMLSGLEGMQPAVAAALPEICELFHTSSQELATRCASLLCSSDAP